MLKNGLLDLCFPELVTPLAESNNSDYAQPKAAILRNPQAAGVCLEAE
jgi:hypothetical protein